VLLKSSKETCTWGKLVAGYYASGQMVSKYQQLQSQNKISNEEATSLTQERNEQRRLRNSLVGKLSEAIAGGDSVASDDILISPSS
jgi:hypothetical protein